MRKNNQRILFWGPQCVSYWNQYFCAPVYERLKPFGWRTNYYFPPVNEFGSGLNKCWKEYYPDYYEAYGVYPDYNILDEMQRSVFWYNDAQAMADALESKLSHLEPDVIITRTNGHDYLEILFPDTPILTMAEAMGAPWFDQECFSLTANPNFHGLPHLEDHPEQPFKCEDPHPAAKDLFGKLTRMEILPEDDLRIARSYFDELRKKYDRIYLYPADYSGPECIYLFNRFDGERYTSNADVIHNFKKNTDDRTALLVTEHPLAKRQTTTPLSDIFHPNSRIITKENTRLGPQLFNTATLAHFGDGIIVRNSKAFWYALVNSKPLLNLGSQLLSAIRPHTTYETFLDATSASVSREEAIQIFYWQATRQRIALRENDKISKMLHRVIEMHKKQKIAQAPADLWEWGNTNDYHASFEHMLKAYNGEFYFP